MFFNRSLYKSTFPSKEPLNSAYLHETTHIQLDSLHHSVCVDANEKFNRLIKRGFSKSDKS